jgi:hypothetical protein
MAQINGEFTEAEVDQAEADQAEADPAEAEAESEAEAEADHGDGDGAASHHTTLLPVRWDLAEPVPPGTEVAGVAHNGSLLVELHEPFLEKQSRVDGTDYVVVFALERDSAHVTWSTDDKSSASRTAETENTAETEASPEASIDWAGVLLALYTATPPRYAKHLKLGQMFYAPQGGTDLAVITHGLVGRRLCAPSAVQSMASRCSKIKGDRRPSKVHIVRVIDRRKEKRDAEMQRVEREAVRILLKEQQERWGKVWRDAEQRCGSRNFAHFFRSLTGDIRKRRKSTKLGMDLFPQRPQLGNRSQLDTVYWVKHQKLQPYVLVATSASGQLNMQPRTNASEAECTPPPCDAGAPTAAHSYPFQLSTNEPPTVLIPGLLGWPLGLVERAAAEHELAKAISVLADSGSHASQLLGVPALWPRRDARKLAHAVGHDLSTSSPAVNSIQAVIAALALDSIPDLACEARWISLVARTVFGISASLDPALARLWLAFGQTCKMANTPLLLADLWSAALKLKPSGVGLLVATASHLGGAVRVVAIGPTAPKRIQEVLVVGDVIEKVNGVEAAAGEASVFRTGGLPRGTVSLTIRDRCQFIDEAEGEEQVGYDFKFGVSQDFIAEPDARTPMEPAVEEVFFAAQPLAEGVAEQIARRVVLGENRPAFGDQRRTHWACCWAMPSTSSIREPALSQDAFDRCRPLDNCETLPGVVNRLVELGFPSELVSYDGSSCGCVFGCGEGVQHRCVLLPTVGRLLFTVRQQILQNLGAPPLFVRAKEVGHAVRLIDLLHQRLAEHEVLRCNITEFALEQPASYTFSVNLGLFADGATVGRDSLVNVGVKLCDKVRDDRNVMLFRTGRSAFYCWIKIWISEHQVNCCGCAIGQGIPQLCVMMAQIIQVTEIHVRHMQIHDLDNLITEQLLEVNALLLRPFGKSSAAIQVTYNLDARCLAPPPLLPSQCLNPMSGTPPPLLPSQ